MDRTGRVEGRTVTTSSRGVRGRHSTSDLPVTPTPLAPGFHHGIGEARYSTQPSVIPFRSQSPLQPHMSHTLVPYKPYRSVHSSLNPTDTVYDPYLHAPTVVRPRMPYRSATQEPILEFRGQPRQIEVEFFYQMLGAAPQDSSCSTHGYSQAEYGVLSSDPYVPGPADRADERGDDDGDGGDSDQDEGDDDGDEEQTVYVAPVVPGSGSNGRLSHGKGKGLTGSIISVMSKIAGPRNKRLEVARDVPAPTKKRKKVKASDWEQTGVAERGPIDPELIPSYGGHVADLIWRGQIFIFMLK
ncbi:hypothetical protein M9H77_02323 [Catharanthus roseus]|uniref:Uncharacterized protein n=1 Tax=Catharanthus roseus TaxID=4058 RepID=A0ACC0C842_CATRO|nr:hypothetical protein M9H77_02323 [Catharanthus roseus]